MLRKSLETDQVVNDFNDMGQVIELDETFRAAAGRVLGCIDTGGSRRKVGRHDVCSRSSRGSIQTDRKRCGCGNKRDLDHFQAFVAGGYAAV